MIVVVVLLLFLLWWIVAKLLLVLLLLPLLGQYLTLLQNHIAKGLWLLLRMLRFCWRITPWMIRRQLPWLLRLDVDCPRLLLLPPRLTVLIQRVQLLRLLWLDGCCHQVLAPQLCRQLLIAVQNHQMLLLRLNHWMMCRFNVLHSAGLQFNHHGCLGLL